MQLKNKRNEPCKWFKQSKTNRRVLIFIKRYLERNGVKYDDNVSEFSTDL